MASFLKKIFIWVKVFIFHKLLLSPNDLTQNVKTLKILKKKEEKSKKEPLQIFLNNE